MKKSVLEIVLVVLLVLVPFVMNAENKYTGVKSCTPCHTGVTKGDQAGIWSKSKHAGAFTTLTTDKAIAIGKAKGIAVPSESKECLECHSLGKTVDVGLFDTKFDIKSGVQCETCHNAGSAYKTMGIMKDKAKSIENGLAAYADEKAIEEKCKSCHNEKSPSYKPFVFKEMWEKIKHQKPSK